MIRSHSGSFRIPNEELKLEDRPHITIDELMGFRIPNEELKQK